MENNTYVKFLYESCSEEDEEEAGLMEASSEGAVRSRRGTGDHALSSAGEADGGDAGGPAQPPPVTPARVPYSFLLVRITSKAPCVVLWLAFLGGTPGPVRQREIKDLTRRLEAMTIHQNVKGRGGGSEAEPTVESEKACLITAKRLEKLVVRYDEVPHELRPFLRPKKRKPKKIKKAK